MRTKFSGARAVRRGTVMAVVGMFAFAMSASTASAAEAGVGSATGNSTENPVTGCRTVPCPILGQPLLNTVLELVPVAGPILEGILQGIVGDGATPLCGVVSDPNTITFSETGTYTTNSGANRFAGTVNDVEISVTTPYGASPAGTFTDTVCTPSKLGAVPAKLSNFAGVTALAGTSAVSCADNGAGTGTYQRINSAVVIAVPATCTINGSTTTVTLRFAGNQLPCTGTGPPTDPCSTPAQQLQVAYTEN